MKTPSKLNYDNVPGIKASGKLLVKSILRKFYIKPKNKIVHVTLSTVHLLKNFIYKAYVDNIHLPIDKPISNNKGMKGVFLVASYTDKDKDYLPGMIASADSFGGIILYHDKNKKHNFKYNESLRFQKLIAAAKRHDAEWVLIGSPKTRFSSKFRQQIEPYIKKYTGKKVILGLKERYLWGQFDQYAYPSNIQGDAIIHKFFTITADMVFDNHPIHATQHPINYNEMITTNASRYYLGRFNLDTMKAKAQFYSQKDGKDYSYLYNMSKPIKHNENVLGIGDFEKKELLDN